MVSSQDGTRLGLTLTGLYRVLVPLSDPTTPDILSSVEFFRRPVLIKRTDDGQVEEAAGYSIASVFTPSEKRGKGYAGQMMRMLHQKIREGSPVPGEPSQPPKDNALSFLYSDVGRDFYAGLGDGDDAGWQVTGVRTTQWSANALASLSAEASSPATAVTSAELPLIAMIDQSVLERELESPNVSAPAFAVLPTPGTFQWICDRADHWEQTHGRPRHRIWGYTIGELGQPDFSFILFTYEGQKRYIKLTRMRIAPGKEQTHATELLKRVGQSAVNAGFDRVVGWQVAQTVLDALPEPAKGATAERNDSLSALKTYGIEGTMTWVANEGYAWC